MLPLYILGRNVGTYDAWDESGEPGEIMFMGVKSTIEGFPVDDIVVDYNGGVIRIHDVEGNVVKAIDIVELVKHLPIEE